MRHAVMLDLLGTVAVLDRDGIGDSAGSHSWHVRLAVDSDVDAIIDLATEAVAHSVSTLRTVPVAEVQAFRRRDMETLRAVFHQPNVGVFVAVDACERLLGHVVVVCDSLESSTGEMQGWVFDLAVVPEKWGVGVGRALMAEAERFTLHHGHAYLGLGVTTSNARAVAFYENLGYTEERKRMIKRLETGVVQATQDGSVEVRLRADAHEVGAVGS